MILMNHFRNMCCLRETSSSYGCEYDCDCFLGWRSQPCGI